MKTFVILAVASVALVGCGLAQREQVQAQQEAVQQQAQQWRESEQALLTQQEQKCDEQTQSADFDPIRNKVELCKFGEKVKVAPFEYLANNTYPTATEKQAIAKWGVIRDQLQRNANAFLSATPPGVPADVWNQIQSNIQKSQELQNELAVGLYQGKLTYGAFAKRRQDIVNVSMTANQNLIEAAKEADYQRRVEAAALAEQHYQTQVQEQENWLRVMNIGTDMMQGGSGNGGGIGSTGRVICTNNSMASGTMPNPTVCQNF